MRDPVSQDVDPFDEDEDDLSDPLDDFILGQVAAAPPKPLNSLHSKPSLAVGDLVDGRFRIDREIGRGGMGVVYEATDVQLERAVALKVVRLDRAGDDLEAHLELLEGEAKAIAKINDPNVVTLFHAGHHEDTLYLVLELLEGETLADRLARGPLPFEAALDTFTQILDGLQSAHAMGIHHRDVKPHNVFLTVRGEVKVLDFGLASLAVASGVGGAEAGGGYASSARGGTPAYMAPEQWRGERGDARSDVFSAGVLLFEMLTGKLPYDARAARPERLQSNLRQTLPFAPPALERALDRAFEHAPAARYESAGAFREALGGAMRNQTWYVRARRSSLLRNPRRSLSIALAALIALGAVGGFAYKAWLDARIARNAAWLAGIDGTWTASEGMGIVILERTGARELSWRGIKDPSAAEPADGLFRNRGTAKVVLGARLVLEADLLDEPGWCCGLQLYKEAEMLGPDEILIYRNEYAAPGKKMRPSIFEYRLTRSSSDGR